MNAPTILAVSVTTPRPRKSATARHADAERMRERRGQRAHEDLPFGHGCGARWSGANTSHCARCHRTFSGVAGFDDHRKDGQCLDPATVGMSLLDGRSYPVWGFPLEPADA